jgi:hypothetical protein
VAKIALNNGHSMSEENLPLLNFSAGILLMHFYSALVNVDIKALGVNEDPERPDWANFHPFGQLLTLGSF